LATTTETTTENSVLRTRTNGCYELTKNTWGTYLAPVSDPLADTVITKEQLEGFELADNLPKIPASLWERWMNLCFEMTRRNSANLEVSCRFLRNIADPTLYRIVVPEQRVTGVSVRVDSFDKAVDIETGEVVSQWPPEGWRPCGSSHSHNSMQAFFSGTDDHYELGDPGLHIVVGEVDPELKNYTIKASVTANRRRFDIDADRVVELECDSTDEAMYHPSVLTIISLPAQSAAASSIGIQPWSMWGSPSTLDSYTGYNSYSPVQAVDTRPVDAEHTAVLAAIEQLVQACKDKGLPTRDILFDLSLELDEQASEACRVFDDMLTDPFAYSTY
jgi:hypothetical protein